MEAIAPRVITPVQQVNNDTDAPAEQLTSTKHIEKPLEAGYIEDLWGVGEASGHFKMPELLKSIDEYVLEQIEYHKLDKSRKSFEEIVKRYEDKLNLPENIDIYTKTERIAELMKIDKKMYDAIKEKQALLEKDPTEMTAAELRKYVKERL